LANKPPTTYKALLEGVPSVGHLPELGGTSKLLARGLLVAAGALILVASAYAVFALLPASFGPEPGTQQAHEERVDYWTPEEGYQTFLRPRTDQIQRSADGLELVRRLDGPHSPRGDEFRVGLEEGWRLAEAPAAHAAFPATSLWQQPAETVYVGVPWETQAGDRVVLFDDFQRLHEVQRHGLTLVKYHASEPNQFLVDGDQVWFRAAERTAFVEPISGTVVDYEDEETIWRASLEGPALLHEVQPPREQREKVWEATIEPTPGAQAQRAEQAETARAQQLEHLLAIGLPGLVVGEVLIGAGLLGRPKRWLAQPS
jgi:hypothetical protein